MTDISLGLLNQGQVSSRGKKPKRIILSAMAVPESAAIGSAVAMISADGTAPISFAITADPDGKFALRGDWLLLAAPLDYATAAAHRVEITAMNSAGWVAETFTIAVIDIAAPTDIALSATSVPEDAAVGSAIAMIAADGSTPVGFSITADPDGQFAISGDQLLLAAPLDYETATAHQVKITASNGAGSVSEVFTIAVTDVVEAAAPSDIALSAVSVAENAAVGSVVATISADGTAPVGFSKVSDPDGKFAVSGDRLLLAAALDYETATAHQVTLRATNASGSQDASFTIAVTDVVEAVAPSDIALSVASVAENAAVGSVVATISADGTAPVGFSKVSDPDGKFAVSGDRLLLAAALDYETATAHQVTLRATNAAGTQDESFTIAVTDVVEAVAPSDVALSVVSVAENAAVGSTVATISADGTAPVGFSKVSDHDGKFAVSGDRLLLAAALDYETATAHQVTLRATNAAGSQDASFTIAVTDVAEGSLANPVGIALGATAAIGQVTTAQALGTLYWVATASPTAPSPAQIAAGQDHTGAPAADAGAQSVTASGAQLLDPIPRELAAETTYHLHFMHDAGGQSATASTAGFTTGPLSSVFPEPGADIAGFRDTGATTSHTVGKPAEAQAGDVIVVALRVAAFQVTVTPPAGWVEIANINQGEQWVFAKVAEAGEPSTYTFTCSSSARWLSIAFRVARAVLAGADSLPCSFDMQVNNVPALSPTWGRRKTLWAALISGRTAVKTMTGPHRRPTTRISSPTKAGRGRARPTSPGLSPPVSWRRRARIPAASAIPARSRRDR